MTTISIKRRVAAACLPLFLFTAVSLVGCGGASSTTEKFSLQQQTEQFVATAPVPGAAVLFIDHGHSNVAVAGNRFADHASPLRLSDRVPLGSNSKAITATLIARLIEKGAMRWDSTLAELLPSMADAMLPVYRSVTIEMLLRHRSGLIPLTSAADIGILGSTGLFTGDLDRDRRALAAQALATAPRFKPDTDAEYGNTNYLIAGLVAEQVSGLDYVSAVQREVFQPIGAQGQIDIDPTALAGHERLGNTWKAVLPTADEHYLVQLAAAAGGWSMSMPSYALFVQAHLDGLAGTSTLLKKATFEKMHSSPTHNPFGIGWLVLDAGGGTFLSTHTGSDDRSYQMTTALLPAERRAIAIFINGYSAPVLTATDGFGGTLLHQK